MYIYRVKLHWALDVNAVPVDMCGSPNKTGNSPITTVHRWTVV